MPEATMARIAAPFPTRAGRMLWPRPAGGVLPRW